jgi:hypothetical protein
MGTGWADWDAPRAPRERLHVEGVSQGRYCPRCDRQTVWALDGNPNQPGLLACSCGMTVTTLLDLDELDNVRRHYRLATNDLDDMVGLPAGARI